MPSFIDLFTPQAIAMYWEETNNSNIPYLSRTFFGQRQKQGLDLKWLKGYKGLPVSLLPSTFDAKARFRDPIGLEAINTEMPFFREGYLIKEKDRQEMLRILDSGDPYAREAIARCFDGVSELIEGARVVAEREVCQLLAPKSGEASISITANGVDYTYDYDPNSTWKTNNYTDISATANDKWSASTTADPISNIQAIDEDASARGITLSYMIMSYKTFGYLLKSESVRSAILAQNLTANVFVTDAVVRNVFRTLLGKEIIIANGQYKDETGATKQFFPDDYVTLVPDGELGVVWKGTTPEEADLMASSTARVSIVDGGTAVSQIIVPHPVNVETYVSEIVLPSFERMDEVFVAKVN